MYLSIPANGQVDYRVRGIHVRLEVRWDWQAEQGDDTHQALYRGECGKQRRQGCATTKAKQQVLCATRWEPVDSAAHGTHRG
jgi:hypothetical protein